ncbi:M15 family metallopeptidase [Ruminococcus sp. OA3]|uniref:M15 family metallopeptidase n=1 Tax=Ruminococcus sp. OA3 TaxID=2914164 RepID=UPI001F06824B|nr:M15 family metallopeptidase [Ruminococcus sp. OA3]MCH1983597.1 M15 family metallopeptidase [Ruminococcus sp. OA3]
MKKSVKWMMAAAVCAAGAVLLTYRFTGNREAEAENTPDQNVEKAAEEENERQEVQEDIQEIREKDEETSETVSAGDIRQMAAETVLTEEQIASVGEDSLFYQEEISDVIFERMYGKSFKGDCTVPREELRYVRVLHNGFDGEAHIGELVVNQAIADDVTSIFRELYQSGYPIEKIRLIDDYDADDEQSMADNNSSAFNFRFISHSTTLSNHARGMAVDINPKYNPYVKIVNGKENCEPANAREYADRTAEFLYKIDTGDLCYQVFTKYGFSWGGSWTSAKDYQHFEKA